jgi:hypothetical protein
LLLRFLLSIEIGGTSRVGLPRGKTGLLFCPSAGLFGLTPSLLLSRVPRNVVFSWRPGMFAVALCFLFRGLMDLLLGWTAWLLALTLRRLLRRGTRLLLDPRPCLFGLALCVPFRGLRRLVFGSTAYLFGLTLGLLLHRGKSVTTGVCGLALYFRFRRETRILFG